MKGRTYRYFTGEPLYPFGHGLSYTRFAYAKLAVPKKAAVGRAGRGVGRGPERRRAMAADEVVQLYVTDVEASAPVPLRALKGFERVSLQPGEKRVVRFTLDDRAFSLVGDGRPARRRARPRSRSRSAASSRGSRARPTRRRRWC